MNKDSIEREMLICQCLSLLPTEDFDCPLLDYSNYKLSTKSLVKTFVAAQLDHWSSYSHMEEKLEAYPELRMEIGIEEISRSQLSRRINELPTELVQKLFIKVVEKLSQLTKGLKGLPNGLGRLRIIDSTEIKLPHNLCDWAKISKKKTGVKMHTRLMVASPDVVYADRIVPSSGRLSDFESSDVMIEESDYIYIMDRGYPSRENLQSWQAKEISFVARVSKSLRLGILEEYTPTHSSVVQDAKVSYTVSQPPVRYVEFIDEKQRTYRILTNRFDLTDQQIMELYRARWTIELFFKWIKQHLRFTKIWSTKPQGIWNQMFLALIAYGLTLIVKLQTNSKKTPWEFFRLLQTYLYKTVGSFTKALNKKNKKTSKGRQKVPIPKQKVSPELGNVALDKKGTKERKRR